MHHTAARLPESPPAGPVFDQMACPAVVEAGKQLVSGRIGPRQFDAVVECEREAWERRQAGGSGTHRPPAHVVAVSHAR